MATPRTRGRGRPRLAEPRSRLVVFKVTVAEYEAIAAAAAAKRLTVSSWVRVLVLDVLTSMRAS